VDRGALAGAVRRAEVGHSLTLASLILSRSISALAQFIFFGVKPKVNKTDARQLKS